MSEIQRVFQGYVAAEPLSHDGVRYAPGMPVDLTGDQAKTMLDKGLIKTVYREFVVDDPDDIKPLPDLPESAYPADAQPIPTEPEHAASGQKPHQVATRSSKGAKA